MIEVTGDTTLAWAPSADDVSAWTLLVAGEERGVLRHDGGRATIALGAVELAVRATDGPGTALVAPDGGLLAEHRTEGWGRRARVASPGAPTIALTAQLGRPLRIDLGRAPIGRVTHSHGPDGRPDVVVEARGVPRATPIGPALLLAGSVVLLDALGRAPTAEGQAFLRP